MNVSKLAITATVLSTLMFGCSRSTDVSLTHGEPIQWQQSNDIVVVNYFAEWCAPCLRELPELNEFYHSQVLNGEGVRLIGISFDALNNEQIRGLAQQQGIEYPLALSQPVPSLPLERPKMLPATYIINKDGQVAATLMGEQTLQSLQQAVAELKHYP